MYTVCLFIFNTAFISFAGFLLLVVLIISLTEQQQLLPTAQICFVFIVIEMSLVCLINRLMPTRKEKQNCLKWK